MNKQTEERVLEIEKRLAEIDQQIAVLQQEREDTLYNDEEYGGYLEHYQAFYDDKPLSIRVYYELSEELERINQEFMTAKGEDFEAIWQKYHKRLAYVERRLAA